ncbi:NUDIX domain-containing protein [Streptomyces sp. NPDC001604]|uniref:NUDIX domain-containing protein n=1 Tax=Streptomyces sp. NPDC001604 TaxID=3364593 RepID=UPI0036C92E07
MNSDGQWRKRHSRILFAGGPHSRIRLTVDQAVRPDGVTVEYPHVAAPDSVRVLAIHRGQVAMVAQDHYLHGTITDLPGGLIEEDEQPADAAGRELAEETGLQAAWMYPLGAVATARAVSTERSHLFLAHGCVPDDRALDAGESLQLQGRSWHDLVDGDARALQGAKLPALADAASLATLHRVDTLMRSSGDNLPSPDDDLPKAAWAAYTVVAAGGAHFADDRVILVWLDLAVGRFAEGQALLAELEAVYDGPDTEAAWAQAAHRLWFMAQQR